MGCTSSKIEPELEENIPLKRKNLTVMRGDLGVKYEARLSRDEKLKDKQKKLITAAEEMAGKIMEEKEMLSLGTRSRTTSCVTSRTASPTNNNRKQVHFLNEDMEDANSDSRETVHALSNGNTFISKNDKIKTKNPSKSTENTNNAKSKTRTAMKSASKYSKSNGLKIESTKLSTGAKQTCSLTNEHSEQTKSSSVKEEQASAIKRLSTIDERVISGSSEKIDSELIKRG